MKLSRPFAVLALAGLLVTACGDDNNDKNSTNQPTASAAASTPAGSTGSTGSASSAGSTASPAGGAVKIKVGSADFPESQLLAEIYTQALDSAGIDASRTDPIGARELYYPAIVKGEVQLLPEYTNALLTFVKAQGGNAPTAVPAKAATIEDQVAELKQVLPKELTVSGVSTAEDKDVIVCRKEVADKYSLTNLTELAAKAAEIKLGAPPEFETRTPFGLKGFKDILGATFKEFVPLKIAQVSDSLKAGAIDCGNLFSTMSVITTEGFVALDDDKTLVPHEAVFALVSAQAATPQVTKVLDEVASKLTTDALKKMMVKVEVDKTGFDVVAKDFLK